MVCVECGKSFMPGKAEAYEKHTEACAYWGLGLVCGKLVYLIGAGKKGHMQVQDQKTGHRRSFIDIINAQDTIEWIRELTPEERVEGERIYLGGKA